MVVPAVAAANSIQIDEGNATLYYCRSKIRINQTSQTFLPELLAEAFKQIIPRQN